MDSAARFLARFAIVVALVVVVTVVAVIGRDGAVTLGVAATSFLLLVAALGALLFVLLRGEFPQRIGRDAVEFTSDDRAAAARSLAVIEATIEEWGAKIDDLADAVIALTDRVDALERRL